ncbi:hypothetical protein KC352_g75 [Hortaea werneckii]|nr:hypothetical protein KC352_g75 [Hortaea werneckii]
MALAILFVLSEHRLRPSLIAVDMPSRVSMYARQRCVKRKWDRGSVKPVPIWLASICSPRVTKNSTFFGIKSKSQYATMIVCGLTNPRVSRSTLRTRSLSFSHQCLFRLLKSWMLAPFLYGLSMHMACRRASTDTGACANEIHSRSRKATSVSGLDIVDTFPERPHIRAKNASEDFASGSPVRIGPEISHSRIPSASSLLQASKQSTCSCSSEGDHCFSESGEKSSWRTLEWLAFTENKVVRQDNPRWLINIDLPQPALPLIQRPNHQFQEPFHHCGGSRRSAQKPRNEDNPFNITVTFRASWIFPHGEIE